MARTPTTLEPGGRKNRYVMEYTITQGKRNSTYSFLAADAGGRLTYIITPRDTARLVLSTPIASTLKDAASLVVVVTGRATYDAMAGRFPKGKISIDVSHRDSSKTPGSPFSADEIAKGYLEGGRAGKGKELPLKIGQGLAKAADVGNAVGNAGSGTTALLGAIYTATNISTAAGTTSAVALFEVAALGSGVVIVAASVGGYKLGQALVELVPVVGTFTGDWWYETFSNDEPDESAGEGNDGEEASDSEDAGDSGADDGDDEDDEDAEAAPAGEPVDTSETDDDDDADLDEDTGGRPADPDTEIDPHALALIDWLLTQPGVRRPQANPRDPKSPLILVSELRGGTPDEARLTIRIDRVTRPSDSGGSSSGSTRGPRPVGTGVIDYVDGKYPGAIPSPAGMHSGTGSLAGVGGASGGADHWECPWVFIPGGDCGYYYCPYERNPITGEPIQQLIEAECHE